MADGGGVKQFAGEVGQAAKEVVKDTSGALQDIGQQAVESVTGNYQNPQQKQQNQQSQQSSQQIQNNQQSQLKDQQEIQRIRNWIANLQNEQGKVRQEAKQKQILLKQQEEEEKRKKLAEEEQRKQTIPSPAGPTRVPGIFTPRKKVREDIARTQPELRAGHGSGG